MRIRIVIVAAIVTGGGLAACSKPEARLGGNNSPDARQIRLAEPPPPADSAVVSDLEAHQPLKTALIRRSAGTVPVARVSVPSLQLEPAAPHMMSLTSSSLAEAAPVADLAPAPEAKAIGFGGQIGHGLGAFELPASAPQTLAGGLRGGGILIRGGMGGIDDKCDTRGGHRGGIAINRMTPFGRGGIR